MARVLINTTIVVLISCCLCLISAVPIERRRFNGPHKQIKGLASKGKLFSGAGTFYEVGSGSCGEFDTDSDLVVAVNQAQMKNGANPNTNPLCDKMVYITGLQGSTAAKVVDTCPSCDNGALDMSPQVFKKVCGSLSEGVCSINWSYM